MRGERKSPWPRLSRDSVLFTTGVLLTVREAVWEQGPERPSLLLLFAGMMGLPPLLRYAEARFDARREADE